MHTTRRRRQGPTSRARSCLGVHLAAARHSDRVLQTSEFDLQSWSADRSTGAHGGIRIGRTKRGRRARRHLVATASPRAMQRGENAEVRLFREFAGVALEWVARVGRNLDGCYYNEEPRRNSGSHRSIGAAVISLRRASRVLRARASRNRRHGNSLMRADGGKIKSRRK